MIRSSVLFPDPLPPITPILAARIKRQPDVLKDLFLAIGLGEVFDREDVLWRHNLSLTVSCDVQGRNKQQTHAMCRRNQVAGARRVPSARTRG